MRWRSAPGRRGRFLTQRLAFTHRRVRRLRGLLQKRSARWTERVFVAEGAELLRCALEAGAPIESVYVAPDGADDRRPRRVPAPGRRGAGVFPLAPGVLERVADTVTPQPVLAVLPMLDRAAADERSAGTCALVVVLVDVRDPGNAGTVLRAADASGSARSSSRADSVDPYNPKTVRASAGSLFHVPFAVAARSGAAGRRAGRAPASARWPPSCADGDDYAALDWSVADRPVPRQRVGRADPGAGRPARRRRGHPHGGQAESLNVGVACAVVVLRGVPPATGRRCRAMREPVASAGAESEVDMVTDNVELESKASPRDGEGPSRPRLDRRAGRGGDRAPGQALRPGPGPPRARALEPEARKGPGGGSTRCGPTLEALLAARRSELPRPSGPRPRGRTGST